MDTRRQSLESLEDQDIHEPHIKASLNLNIFAPYMVSNEEEKCKNT